MTRLSIPSPPPEAMPKARSRRASAVRILLVVLGALAIVGCGDDASSARPDGPVVVTFEVVGDERFRALLTDADDVDLAYRLLAGEDVPSIPNGLVVRETGVNEGWSWSLDPNDFEFADVTIEVCDGLPSDVEAGNVTSDRYCPWSAVVVAVEPSDR